jgi:hypothetical protein
VEGVVLDVIGGPIMHLFHQPALADLSCSLWDEESTLLSKPTASPTNTWKPERATLQPIKTRKRWCETNSD